MFFGVGSFWHVFWYEMQGAHFRKNKISITPQKRVFSRVLLYLTLVKLFENKSKLFSQEGTKIFFLKSPSLPIPYILPPSLPSNPQKRVKWLTNMRRLKWIPSSHSRICSGHFKERFIDRTGQIVQLRDDAIATRFKNYPKHLKKVINILNYLTKNDCNNV